MSPRNRSTSRAAVRVTHAFVHKGRLITNAEQASALSAEDRADRVTRGYLEELGSAPSPTSEAKE